jgi:F-type H+-transporting ATPase subunit a
MFSPLEQFDVVRVIKFAHGGFDLSFYNVILPFFSIIFFFSILIFFFKNEVTLVPGVWQYIFEKIYIFIFRIVENFIGEKGVIYFPFIFTLFNFILLCNLFSLFPFGIALTSHIILVIFLSTTICVSVFVIGLNLHGISFLKIFIPRCPPILLFLLIPIELFSYWIRVLSLAIRLVANILAGHTLVSIVGAFVLKVSSIKFIFFFFSIILLWAVIVLEFGVAFLQAYVFTVLVCIYLKDSISPSFH